MTDSAGPMDRLGAEYRIETRGSEFSVIDPWGVQVGRYTTAKAAERSIDRCKKEDAMYAAAKLLISAAITTHMEQFSIDRGEVRYWIGSAAETTD